MKAARALLGWSAAELAEKSCVGATTIRRYEMGEGIPNANVKTMQLLKDAFQLAGIEFTGDPLVNPGVTLNIKRRVIPLDDASES